MRLGRGISVQTDRPAGTVVVRLPLIRTRPIAAHHGFPGPLALRAVQSHLRSDARLELSASTQRRV